MKFRIKQQIRRQLILISEKCIILSKKCHGAANRLSPEKKITLYDCEKEGWKNVRPCFVLSSGRTGTLLLNRLLSLSQDAYAFHQPAPELIRSSKLAYEKIHEMPETFKEVFKSAREELVLRAAQLEKIYIETNNRITFFAPIIQNVFPNANFIHLVRHPYDFIRSGIRRNWYSGQHDHDIGRIIPYEGKISMQWGKMSQIEKIAWLWNETNQFIEDFKKNNPLDTVLFIKSEEMFTNPEIIKKVFVFIHLEKFYYNKVNTLLKHPINVQRKGTFPAVKDWNQEIKNQIMHFIPLAKRYNYSL